MTAYYNEINPTAAQWLRNLIAGGHIAPGVVDERSIEDVTPDELREFTQCHFFAGVGVWSYALRLAGWPDNKPVWTGSCPCQPFSQAGKGAGFDDERHLWPAFFHLISERRPNVVFGEQVASKDGLAWLDLVQTDLEAKDYPCWAVDFCSAGLGAPHIRQRIYWVANTSSIRKRSHSLGRTWNEYAPPGRQQSTATITGSCRVSSVADSHCKQYKNGDQRPIENNFKDGGWAPTEFTGFCSVGCMANSISNGPQGRICGRAGPQWEIINGSSGCDGTAYRALQVNGFWRDADWIWCRDQKWRPIESSIEPLANGDSSRVGRLRAYGNAINAEAARAFIESYMEAHHDPL